MLAGSTWNSLPARTRGSPRISTIGARVQAWVIPTNAEVMIARYTRRMLG